MKKSNVTKKMGIFALALAVSGAITTAPVCNINASAKSIDNSASVQNLAIVRMSNNLELGTLGKLTCTGSTQVVSGTTAKVVVELQQSNGGWNTIKTWSSSGDTYASVNTSYYVEKGYSYRLKLTHSALKSSGSQIESFTKYSRTVTY